MNKNDYQNRNNFLNEKWYDKNYLQEFQDTWAFSIQKEKEYQDFLKQLNNPIKPTKPINVIEYPKESNIDLNNNNNFPNIPKIPNDNNLNQFDTIPSTWNKDLDKSLADIKNIEQNELNNQKENAIKNKKKEFLFWTWKYYENKNYYSNFEEVDNKYKWVIDDIIKEMWNDWYISDKTYSDIANKYWLSIEDVKNPINIFKQAKLTNEWKDKLWINENNLDNLQKNYDRQLEDINTSFWDTERSFEEAIYDFERKLEQNLKWMDFSWVFNWSSKSSWYQKWIENVKYEWQLSINRLKSQLERTKNKKNTTLNRVKEDFENAFKQETDNLNRLMENVTVQHSLELSTLKDKYSWNELTNHINSIIKDYDIKSSEVMWAYLKNINSIISLTNSITEKETKENDRYEEKLYKNYESYIWNNWAVINNSSIKDIVNDYEQWNISLQQAKTLQKIMLNSIESTLGKISPVLPDDIKIIQNMLMQWYTPAEIVAELQTLDRFNPINSTNEKKYWFVNAWEWVIAITDPTTWEIRYQSPYWWLVNMWKSYNNELNNNIWWNNYENTESYNLWDIIAFDWSNLWKISRRSNNIWEDINNPWNIMADTDKQKEYAKKLWAIWFIKSANWRTYAAFNTMQDWLSALRSDLNTKLNWWSSWVTDRTTLWEFATWWTSWPNAEENKKAIENFEKLTWYWKNTLLSSIPINLLENAIIKNEWVNTNKWRTLFNEINSENQNNNSREYTASERVAMEAFEKSNKIKDLANAWLTKDDFNNYKKVKPWYHSKSWADLAFHQSIANMVPTSLKNSNMEWQQLNDIIKSLYESWADALDWVLMYMWVEINKLKKEEKEILRDIVLKSDLFIWDNKDATSSFINTVNRYFINNKPQEWIKLLEKQANEAQRKQYWDSYIWNTEISKLKTNYDELIKLIDKNIWNIWFIEWNMNDLKNKFKSNEDYQKLKTLLSSVLAESRKYYAWSNVTPTELEALADFVWLNTKMPLWNLKTALNTIYDKDLMIYNTFREEVWLPQLTWNDVYLNPNTWKKRYELYKKQALGENYINEKSKQINNMNNNKIIWPIQQQDIENKFNNYYNN